MTDSSNPYCQRLRIPVPTVESAVGQPEVNLFLLMVVALLQHGSPMTLNQIAARLERAALPPRLAKGDLRAALKKAWHGQMPIVRDTDDRLAPDLLFFDWWRLWHSRRSTPACTSSRLTGPRSATSRFRHGAPTCSLSRPRAPCA